MFIHKILSPLKRFAKYNISSGIATFFDFSFLLILTEIFGVFYLFSASLAFLAGSFINYMINRSWVFKKNNLKFAPNLFSFVLIGLSGLLITILILAFLVEIFGLHYFLSRIFALFITLLWNYFLVSSIIFKQPVFK